MKKSILLFGTIATIPVLVTIILKALHLLQGVFTKIIILFTWISAIAVCALFVYKRIKKSANADSHQL